MKEQLPSKTGKELLKGVHKASSFRDEEDVRLFH